MVEDDQFIRELYERQLKLAGFNTTTTYSGQSGLELLDKEDFDLLMLDLNIPDVSGFQILKHLKKETSHRHKNLSILVLSNVTDAVLINKAIQEGANAFIIKSTYTPNQVVAQVRSLLG